MDKQAPRTTVAIRDAEARDVPAIVALLADDVLGQARESTDATTLGDYERAFREIAANGNCVLLVAELDDIVVGTAQLTFIRGLSRRGALKADLEAVRVASARRNRGIGEALVDRAVVLARERGCVSVQLSSHASRTDAHRFYARLGFAASHTGMKLML